MLAERAAGFTLIELLIVVAIVGAIAGIAYPAYTAHLLEARRGVAHTALLDVLRRQQRYRIERRTYATLSALGYADDTVGIDADGQPGGAGGGLYDLSIVAGADARGFTAQAVATGAQVADEDCPVLTIDADGTRAPAALCW